jgi:hypothetical protein
MSSKLDTLDAVIYGAGLLLFIGLMASVILSVIDNPPVANEVANNVANRVKAIETEVYRVVCVESADGYCKEYSVRRITKE